MTFQAYYPARADDRVVEDAGRQIQTVAGRKAD
jgi:hypothetical protein